MIVEFLVYRALSIISTRNLHFLEAGVTSALPAISGKPKRPDAASPSESSTHVALILCLHHLLRPFCCYLRYPLRL